MEEGLAMKLTLLALATPCQLKFCGSSAAGEKNPDGIGGMVVGAGDSIPGNWPIKSIPSRILSKKSSSMVVAAALVFVAGKCF